MAEIDSLIAPSTSPAPDMGSARLADDASMQDLNALQSTSEMGARQAADEQSLKDQERKDRELAKKALDQKEFYKLYPSLQDADELAPGTSDTAAVMLNLSYRMGKPLEEIKSNFEEAKAGYAKNKGWDAAISESGMRAKFQEEFKVEDSKQTALNELYGNVVLKAFEDTTTGLGLPSDYVQEWKTKHQDLIDGDAPYQAQANRIYLQTIKEVAPIRKEIGATLKTLNDFTTGKVGEADMQNLGRVFKDMPSDKMDKILSYVSVAANTQKLDPKMAKGFMQMLGESISRSFDFSGDMETQTELLGLDRLQKRIKQGKDIFLDNGDLMGGKADNDLNRALQVTRYRHNENLTQSDVIDPAEQGRRIGTFRKATPEQVEAMKAEVEDRLKAAKVVIRLKQFAQSAVDPIRPISQDGTWAQTFEQMAYDVGSSVGPMSQTAINPFLGYLAYQTSHLNDLVVRNPDKDLETLNTTANVEGALEAVGDLFQVKMLKGAMPAVLDNYVKKLGNKPARALMRLAEGIGGEYGIETLQDAIPAAVEGTATAMGADINPTAWDDFSVLDARRFWAMAFMGGVGAGVATFSDLKDPSRQLNRTIMGYNGVHGAKAEYVLAAETPEQADARWREVYNERTEADIAKGEQLLEKDAQEAQTQTRGRDSYIVAKRPDGTTEWIVRDPAGKEVARVGSEAEAATIIADRGEAEIKSQANVVADLLDSDWRKDKLPNFEAQFGGEVTPEQLLKDAEARGDTKLVESIKASVEAHGNDPAELAKLRVLGESWVTPYAEGQYKAFVKLNEGHTAQDAFEELAHNIFDIDLAEGRITKDQAREWIRQAAAAGVANYKFGTDAEVRESMAQIAQDFARNKIDQTNLPASFVAFLKKLYTEFVEFMRRAKLLDKAFAEGKIDTEFERYLMGKIGLSDASMIKREVNRIEGEQGGKSFSIRDDASAQEKSFVASDYLSSLKGKKIELPQSDFFSNATIYGIKRSGQSGSFYGSVAFEVPEAKWEHLNQGAERQVGETWESDPDEGEPGEVTVRFRISDHASTESARSSPHIDLRVGKKSEPKFGVFDGADAVFPSWVEAAVNVVREAQSFFGDKGLSETLEKKNPLPVSQEGVDQNGASPIARSKSNLGQRPGEGIGLTGNESQSSPDGKSFSIRARDEAYDAAVKSGDEAEQQRLVDEAAKEAGYPLRAYHGTPNGDFQKFEDNGRGFFFTNKEFVAKGYTYKRGLWLSESPTGKVINTHLKMENPLEIDAMGSRYNNIRFPGMEWKPTVFGNLPKDAVSVSDAALKAFEMGHDGLIVKNVMDAVDHSDKTRSTVYVVKDASQIKSADPITRDDAGNVIPLSQRFNAESNDIRFSIQSQEQIDRVNKAVADTTQFAEGRMALYERAKERFKAVLAENKDILDAADFSKASKESRDYWNAFNQLEELNAREQKEIAQAKKKDFGKAEAQVIKEIAGKFKAQSKALEEQIETQQRLLNEKSSNKIRRAKLIQAIAELEVILRQLPAEVRGKVGGFGVLARGGTGDTFLANFFRDRVRMIDEQLEKYLSNEYDEELSRVFDRTKPKKDKPGEKPKGIGADIQDLFAKVKEAQRWSPEEVNAHLAAIDSRLESEDLSPADEARLTREADLIGLVGGWRNKTSNEKAHAIKTLKETWAKGYYNFILKKTQEKEQRETDRQEAIASTGKEGVLSERQEADKKENGLGGKFKKGYFNLISWDQFVSVLFGEKSDIATRLSNGERKANAQKEDATQAKMDEIADFFAKLAKGDKLKGEQLRWQMSQKSLKPFAGTPWSNLEFSEMEALSATMLWMQEDGRRHMIGKLDETGRPISNWHYTQEFVDLLENNLSKEAKELRDFLLKKYDTEYDSINKVYKALNGINLPKIENYSPVTVAPINAPAGTAIDPVTGGIASARGTSPGALRTRGQAIAEPKFNDVLQTYIAHTKQMEHWKAYAPFMAEANGILRNRDVQNAIEAKGGKEAKAVLNTWTDLFSQGGVRSAEAQLGLSKDISALGGRAARVALVGRLGTIIIQSTQLGAALAEMPTGSYILRMSKLLSGNLGWKAAFESDYIQRRLNEMPPIVRQAVEGLQSDRPNVVKSAVDKLGRLISGADALFTAGTYAITYDYHLKQAKDMGIPSPEAYAKSVAERAVDRLAQPTRMGARSVIENTSTGLIRNFWAFASESRKNLGLAAYAMASKDPARIGRTLVSLVIFNSLVGNIIRNAWSDAKDDDDDEWFDEKHWGIKRMIASTLVDSLQVRGIPVLGDAISTGLYDVFNQYHQGGSLVSFSNATRALKHIPKYMDGDADWETTFKDIDGILSVAGLFNESIAAAASLSHLATDAFGLTKNTKKAVAGD